MSKYLVKLLEFLLSLLNQSKPETKVEDVPTLFNTFDLKDEVVPNPRPLTKPFEIIQHLLPTSQYVQDSKFQINQVVIHHTNGHSFTSTYNYWISNKDRVGCTFCIDRDGSIYQCVPLDKCWIYHLYVAASDNKIPRQFKNLGSQYDKQSIGIELCSMSQLVPYGDKFLDTYGKVFKGEVTKLDKPFRGFEYFESYTQEQIDSLESLLLYLLENYPKLKEGVYSNYEDKFDINQDALDMKPGIFFHVSYRTTTKWDLYPNPNLIKMLNQLHTKI